MDIISLIISLISGVAGGNAAGAALKYTGLPRASARCRAWSAEVLAARCCRQYSAWPATPREGWMPARYFATSSAAAWVAHC
jgi:hypothetical protein